jgi:hypothetical protein
MTLANMRLNGVRMVTATCEVCGRAGLSTAIGRMNVSLPTPTMRRLAIVKYLYTQGLEQERKGGPLAGLALLPLHDAVELFLQVAAEVAAETHQLKLPTRIEFI